MGITYCSYKHCFNNTKWNRDLSFFNFPKDADRLKLWLKACGREDLLNAEPGYANRNLQLCSQHFSDSCFMNVTRKSKLVWDAVPTKFNVPKSPPAAKRNPSRVVPKSRKSSERQELPKHQGLSGSTDSETDMKNLNKTTFMVKTLTGGVYCSAIDCSSSTYKNPDVSFHKFPKENDRCEEWLKRVGRSDLFGKTRELLLKSHKLCSKHFVKEMFMAQDSNRLVWNAVPSIFSNEPLSSVPAASCTTGSKTSDQGTADEEGCSTGNTPVNGSHSTSVVKKESDENVFPSKRPCSSAADKKDSDDIVSPSKRPRRAAAGNRLHDYMASLKKRRYTTVRRKEESDKATSAKTSSRITTKKRGMHARKSCEAVGDRKSARGGYIPRILKAKRSMSTRPVKGSSFTTKKKVLDLDINDVKVRSDDTHETQSQPGGNIKVVDVRMLTQKLKDENSDDCQTKSGTPRIVKVSAGTLKQIKKLYGGKSKLIKVNVRTFKNLKMKTTEEGCDVISREAEKSDTPAESASPSENSEINVGNKEITVKAAESKDPEDNFAEQQTDAHAVNTSTNDVHCNNNPGNTASGDVAKDRESNEVMSTANDNICLTSRVSKKVRNEDDKRLIANYRTRLSRTKKKLEAYEKKILEMMDEGSSEQVVHLAKAYLFDSQVPVLECMLKLGQLSSCNGGWTRDMKQHTLGLYHQCPLAYDIFREMFCLPAANTLRMWVREMCMLSGFNEEVLQLIRQRINSLDDAGKLCSLTLGEVAINPDLSYNWQEDCLDGLVNYGNFGPTKMVATHALVFMVQGLKTSWTQPVAYFLTHGVSGLLLTGLLLECIYKLSSVGLCVKVIIGDDSRCVQSAFNNLGITKVKPYFEYNNEKVFGMLDPVDLLLAVRHNFIRYDISCGDKLYKMEHVRKFLDIAANIPCDSHDSFMYKSDMPTFTANVETNEKSFQTIRSAESELNEASKLFSESMAFGLCLLGSLGKIDSKAQDTGDFLRKMSFLFSIFDNESNKTPGNRKYHSDKNLVNLVEWIESWIFIRKSKLKNPKNSLVSALNCYCQLRRELHFKYKFRFNLSCRLNQASLKQFIMQVHTNTRNDMDLGSVKEFIEAYLLLMENSLLKPIRTSNNLKELEGYVKSINDLVDMKEVGKPSSDKKVHKKMSVQPHVSYEKLYLPQDIAIFIAKVVKLKSECEECVRNICHTDYSLLNIGEYNYSQTEKGDNTFELDKSEALLVPSQSFQDIVNQMESSFVTEFKHVHHMSKLKQRLMNHIYASINFSPCSSNCGVMRYIVELFIHIRMQREISVIVSSLSLD